jgi:hypothetical protein
MPDDGAIITGASGAEMSPPQSESVGPGIEDEDFGPSDRITEPFDPTLIRVESKTMTMDLLIARMKESEIDLKPGFQRRAGIWKDEAQSRLIESLLIRIPIPAFYMDATDENKWLVVDGLQRLSSIRRFVIDKTLKLVGLEFLRHLDGKTFDGLTRNFQRRINETQITAYLIEKGTPPEVKFNIFKRINTGGLPLSSQEIRHALNQGEAALMLERLAGSDAFKKATNYSVPSERMADREFVLRYLAFMVRPYTEYKVKDYDGFLNDSMAEINRLAGADAGQLAAFEKAFGRAMGTAYAIFGKDAFRKRFKRGDRRKPINKALFESLSVNLAKLSDEALATLVAQKEVVKDRLIELTGTNFVEAISQSTGDTSKVQTRFSKIELLLRSVLHDHQNPSA